MPTVCYRTPCVLHPPRSFSSSPPFKPSNTAASPHTLPILGASALEGYHLAPPVSRLFSSLVHLVEDVRVGLFVVNPKHRTQDPEPQSLAAGPMVRKAATPMPDLPYRHWYREPDEEAPPAGWRSARWRRDIARNSADGWMRKSSAWAVGWLPKKAVSKTPGIVFMSKF